MASDPRGRGYHGVVDDNYPHLGGNVVEGDPYCFCPTVWDYVINRFCIRSVLDIGSGLGHAADYFFRKGVAVVAMDGLPANIKNAVYPTVLWDLTRGAFATRVDLVYCQEVVEHVEQQYLGNLLSSMTSGKYILMTNGTPGQGGHHHTNEQPTEYWEKHLLRYDCCRLDEDSRRVRHLGEKDGAPFMSLTGTIYANRRRLPLS